MRLLQPKADPPVAEVRIQYPRQSYNKIMNKEFSVAKMGKLLGPIGLGIATIIGIRYMTRSTESKKDKSNKN